MLASGLVYQAVNGTPLTLLLSGNTLEVVQTGSPNTVLASNRLNQTTAGIQIGAGGFDVSLTIDASLPAGVPGGVLFDGGSGTATLLGPNANRTWHISGTGSGDVGGATGVQFTNVKSLVGNSGADTFVFANGASVAGTVAGGGGVNTLDYSAYASSSPVTLNLGASTATGTAGFTGIQGVVGGQGADTVIGPAASSTWNLTGTNAGNVAGLGFTSFENMTGGAGADVFVFASGNPVGSVSGSISGGGGTNTLNYAAYPTSSPVTVNLAANTATGTGGVGGITSVVGGQGSDTLIGPAAGSTWNITGTNAGSVTGVGFTSFENLTGGAGADSFVFANGASAGGIIAGGDGANVLDYSAYAPTSVMMVNLALSTATGAGGFSGIQRFVGGQGSDTFFGPAADSIWNITGTNAGNVAGMSFSGFENLRGGAGSDTFIFANATPLGSVLGGIFGGGGTNMLDYSAYPSPVTVNLATNAATGTGGINSIQSFVGGSASDTFAGPAAGGTWNITGTNAGNVAGIGFTGFENLAGAAGADAFVFANGSPLGSVSGTIAGGGGTNTLNYAAFTSPVSVNLAAGTSPGASGFSGITNVVGGQGPDTLIGPAADSTWNITGTNAGNVAGVGFTGFENLNGGAGADTFVFANGSPLGSVSGTIAGGGGTNTLNYAAYPTSSPVTVNPTATTATGTGGFSGISSVIGGQGADTLIGPAADTNWNITGTSTGNVAGMNFAGFENLTAGAGADTFVFANGASTGGTIAGGGGTNTLNYSAYASSSPVTINLSSSTATGAGSYSGIQSFVGGQGSDTLIGPAAGSTWNITGANAGNVAGVGFTSFENLTGGAGPDGFVFASSAAVAGAITGGGGADSLNYSAYTTPVTVNLGAKTATGTGGASGFTNLIGGSASTDTLIGPTADSTWNLNGQNSGNVAGVAFASFENLTGAANNNDTFILFPAGQLSGKIDGGAGGSDKLVFDDGAGKRVTFAPTGSQSGTVVSQAARSFTYAGMDPVGFFQSDFSDSKNVTITGNPLSPSNSLSLTYFTSALLEFSQGSAGGSIVFAIPANSLTIDMGVLGNNSLSIGSANALVLPGALTINGGFLPLPPSTNGIIPDNQVLLAGALTLGRGLSIDTVIGTTAVSLNAALTVLSGGMTIDNHLALTQTVQLNAPARIRGNVSILGGVLADKVTLSAPLDVLGGDLTIESNVTPVDRALGLDTVSFKSSVNTHGGDVDVDAAMISVGPAAMVSTRNTAPNNPDAFLGNSGAVDFESQLISIGANAQLLADSDPNGVYSPGDVTLAVNIFDVSGALPVDVLPSTNPGISLLDGASILGGQITLTAEKTSQTQILAVSLLSLQSKTTSITIQNATIAGTGVAILANSQDASGITSTAYNVVNNLLIAPSTSLAPPIGPPILSTVSVEERSATATVTLTGATIHATTGDVVVDSTVNVASNAPAGGGYDATVRKPNPKNPLTVIPYSAGYAKAVGSSKTLVGGATAITSDRGSVSLTSEATTSATVQAFTASNALFGGRNARRTKIASGATSLPSIAIGVADTDTTAQALVGQNVQINAKGNVTVNATGNVTNNAWAGSATFGDGTGSFGFAMGTDTTNVLSRVDGHIKAGGIANVLDVNVSKVNQTNDTITIPNHGLTTGQAIVYHAAAPPDPSNPLGTPTPLAPIGGLTDGQTYYVIVRDANTIQLAAAPSIALDATGIDPSATNSLSTRAVKSVTADAIDLSTSTIILPAHGFAELQPVSLATTSDWNILGLAPQGNYYVHVVDANHIQLLTQVVANAGPTPRQLPGSNDYIVPLAATPAPAGSNPKTLTPAGTLVLGYDASPATFHPSTAVQADGSLYLPGNTFNTGDLVTYNVVQGTQTPVEVDRTALFSPASFDVIFNPHATSTTVADNTIGMPMGTTLVTGQRVTYSAGGGKAIGGLTNGATYYVVVTAPGDIQLARTQADALNGVILPLTSSGTGTAHVFHANAVDQTDNELVIRDHQLVTGQQVVYETGGAPPIGGLESGKTYYAIRVSNDLVGLALTRQDASAGNFIKLSGGAGGTQQSLETNTFVSTIDTSQTRPVVDYAANTIELPDSGLVTGQVIQYNPGNGDPIGGLTAGPYSVIVADPDHIQLALTTSPNTPIDLVPLVLDTGLQEFTLGDQTFVFDPLLQPTVNLANSSIWMEGNGFKTGDRITYLTGGGQPIGGLDDGQNYVVIEGVDGDSFQLADPSTPTTPITLTSLGTGSSQGFERVSTGELGTPPIGGLQDAAQYYVTRVDVDHIRLSLTSQGAQAAAPIALTLTAAQQSNPNLVQYFTTSDEKPGINVLASLTAQNSQKTESQVGGSPTLSQILLAYIPPAPAAIAKSLLGKPTTVQNPAPFTGAGTIAINLYEHAVTATVGSTAVLQSGTNVTVNASSQNYSQVIANGQVITPQIGGKLVAVAVAVAYGSYDNTVLATVEPNAEVDAAGALTVVSELTYPDLTQFLPFNPDTFDIASPTSGGWMQQLSNALNGRGGLDLLMNVWANSSSTTLGQPSEVSITGSYGSATYKNDSEATIGSGAKINQNPELQADGQFVGVYADTTMSLLNLAGVIKLQLDPTGLRAAAKSKSSPISPFGNQAGLIGVGGSILLQTVDSTTRAQIDTGAIVHTGTGEGGGLGVGATENTVSVNLAQAGGSSGLFGLSGAVSIATQASSTVADLESGVKVYGGPVDVKSKSDLNYYNIAGAAQVAGAVGVGASAAVNYVRRDTEAFIGAQALSTQLAVGNAGTVIEATGMTLDAENTGNILGVSVAGAIVDANLANKTSTGSVQAGSGASGAPALPVSVGVAGAVGINEVTDAAESYINDGGAIDLAQGDIELTSENDTRILAVTGSVSLAALKLLTIGLAGSVSLNTLDETTESFVVGAQVVDVGAVTLDAERAGEVMAVTIAAAGSAPSGQATMAITASPGGTGGGNASASISVDVAASVSLNAVGGKTLAYIRDAAVVGTGAVSLAANDTSAIVADGGGAAIEANLTGNASVGVALAAGVSVAVNNVKTTLEAYLDHARVGRGVPIEIAAENSSAITAITVAGAAVFNSTKSVGLAFSGAGAGSGNTIQNTIRAYVQDCIALQPQSLAVVATDDSQITARAIAVAMSVSLVSSAGVATALSMGGSATVNRIDNDVEAFVHNSTIAALGAIGIKAVESSSISALSIGAAFAVATTANGVSVAGAGAGAGAGNTITNVVSASIAGKSVVDSKGLTVSALDSATIEASADGGAVALGTGGVGVGIGLAVGASVAINTISDMVRAGVDDAKVTSGGILSLTATSQNSIDALVISIAISLGVAGGNIPIGIAASGAGASASNSIQNMVNADVTGGADVTATGSIQIDSADTSTVSSSVSAAALAVGTVAVAAGISITNNTIDNQVAAFVDGSSVRSANQGITITARTTGNASATSIGIAAALAIIGAAAAGAEAASTITSTVQAYANNATLSSSGTTQIVASSSLTAVASSAAASAGVAAGIAVLIPSVTIGGSTLAYVRGTSTVGAASLLVKATSSNQARLPLGLSLAIGLVGGAGAGAHATVTRTTEAHVGAETGGASAAINVPHGNVSIVASSTSSATAKVTGGAFGGINIGAFLVTSTIAGATRAFVGPTATVNAASLTIHATAVENAAAAIVAVGAGVIGGTGANATAGITSVTEAFAGADSVQTPSLPGLSLDITNAIDIVADSTGTASATDQGGSGGGLEVTALLATANDAGQTHAYLGLGLNSAIHAGSLNVEADGSLSADSESVAFGIALITVSDAASASTVGSDDPTEQTVAASIELATGLDWASSNAAVTTPGAIVVKAHETPHASASAIGVDAGALAVDAVSSASKVLGTTRAALGDGITFTALALTLDAERVAANGPTVAASTTAGSGGLLADVNAAESSATSSGTVEAYAGNVMLIGGDVTIAATNASNQSASSTGVAASGLLAVGTDVANASSSISTQATLGPRAMTVLSGTLLVSANGNDENDVSSTSGSGALFAGNAAVGNTDDSSTTSARIGGSLLIAGTVLVTADNNSVFSSDVNSVNASAAGGSGARANNNDNTSASAEVLSYTDPKTNANVKTNIKASMAVNITATNTFTETVPQGGNSVTAGGGGVFNGNAAESSTNLTGNSSVTIDGNVLIDVENPTASTAGASGIFLNASSALHTRDVVTLSTGGGLEGSGINSSLHATLNNTVATRSSPTAPVTLTTNQNIGIGTDTQVNVNNDSEGHTWGVLGALASASATTDVTSNQSVTLGPNTTLTAAQNISLTAGDNPTPGANKATTMVGFSDAQSYARGFIGIPIAHATARLTSNATLAVGADDQIQSGENTKLAADSGTPFATARGIGHGYELFFIPVTNGSSSASAPTNSSVTINGTVTAGAFHTLDITIPDDHSVGGANGDSRTIIVNGGPARSVATAPTRTILSPSASQTSLFVPFTASFKPNFNPFTTIQDAANSGAFPDAGEAQALQAATYNGPVGAIVLGPLFAAGGNVTVNAGTLKGSGTITAFGGPTITVTNNSPDYLVLSSITIPNETGGQVNYTGTAIAPPASLHVIQSGTGARPVVNILESYDGPVPATNTNGPSVFLTAAMDSSGNVSLDPSGSIENEAGQVSVIVANGSLIQAGSINANQVNLTTLKGITAISSGPDGRSSNSGTPATDWSQVMDWPGGYDPFANGAAPANLENLYVAFVANAMYNNPTSVNTRLTSDLAFTRALLGFAGETPLSLTPGSTTGFAFPNTLAGREAATSLVFLGADAPWADTAGDQDTDASAAAQSPSGGFYRFSPNADDGKANDNAQGIFPMVPVEPVSPIRANAIPAITGLLTSGSTSVTSPSSTKGLRQGELVTGNGIAPGTTIQTVGSISFTATTATGSPVIGYFGKTILAVGQSVTGPGMPAGATIVSLGPFNGIAQILTLSAPATATTTTSAVTLTASFLTLTKPATITGNASLTVGTASAINAQSVFITAKYVDINEPINVGQSNNWSVNLPASLNSVIAQDQSNYSKGIYSTTPGDAIGYYTLPASAVSAGDVPIPAQFNAITNQIVLSNVGASSGGFIVLDGEIISTNALGQINVNSGASQVNINNQTNYSIVVNNVAASVSPGSPSLSGVDIIDRNPAVNQQRLYVYQPNNVIDMYIGSVDQTQQELRLGSPTVIQGSSTRYEPQAGLRWEWQLQTTMERPSLIPGDITTAAWHPDLVDVAGLNDPDRPWYYLSTPNGHAQDGTIQATGWTTVDPDETDTEFLETFSGSVTNVLAPLGHAFNGAHGFASTNPPTIINGLTIDPWTFMYALEAELTLTNSVKADNPIGISFTGGTQAFIDITSDRPVILAGNIANPRGDTTIIATSITQNSSASLTSKDLTLRATAGGVGTPAQPLGASLTPGAVLNVQAGSQGVYLALGSGALLGTVSACDAGHPGDVVLNATGSLDAATGLPSGTVNVVGNDLTLNSGTGEIGTAAAPLAIQAYGVVDASALLDIGLNQQSGALQVGQITSTKGNVTIDPDDSPIVSASGMTWASEVGDAQSQQVWQDLSLTNPSGAINQTIAAFENQVNATYAAYWQLADNGSVQDGVFVLNARGLALYAGRAGLALNPHIANPSNAQVQAFANSQYQNDVAFFNQNLGSDWTSSADFQTFNPSFSYVATSKQVADLSSNAAWTTSQLANPVAQVALNPAVGSPVGILTPNISGVNVTLVATGSGGSIGQAGTSTFIPAAALKSGNLTSAQLAALTSASATRAVFLVGLSEGRTVTVPYGQQPADLTLTGIQVFPNQQLFVSATGKLALTAGGTITVQATSQDLTLSQVTAGGTVNIAAQGSILSSGASTGITTHGDVVLKVVTGTVGSPTVPLNVQNVDGGIYVYTLPNHAFLTGGVTTTTAITSGGASSSTYGSSVTFTATVSDSGAGVPTGTVAFYSGATFLGQGTALRGIGNSATSTFTTSTLAAGTYPSITAVFTPTGHFAGSSNSLGFTVNTAALTITANSKSKTYGQTTTFGSTAFTATGLVNGDSITGVSESSLGASASANAGTYNIVPFGAAGSGLSNYSITYVNGTLTVNPAQLTITATNDSKTYGTLKTFGPTAFSATGLLTTNGDTIAGVTETSAGAPVSATLGTYPVLIGAATGNRLNNYTITYVNGTLTVNPAALTITANNDSKTYGALKTFSGTAFTATGLVTANGDTIAGVTETSSGAPVSATVGTYPVAPSAATGTGLSNYTITYVNGALNINRAILTITANDDSKTYGTLKAFSPTAFTAAGLVTANGDTVAVVTEISTGAPVSATVGTYPVVPGAATGTGLSNYTITYVNGTLTVDPAVLTITANNDSKTYGTLKAFSPTAFTSTGLVTVNGDTIIGVTETSTGAPVIATVGTYPLVPGAVTGKALGNYVISYVNGTLTVDPAPLTITANNDSKTYGVLKAFAATAFTATGLVTVNGDGIAGVTETSAGAPVIAQVGTYPIVPGAATGNRLNNYTIMYVNGTLTVNTAPLTITANDDSKPFGTVKAFSPTAFTQVGLVTINGDTITGVTETSTGAPASAPVGTYPIVPGAASGNRLNNYTITYVNGTLTVNQSIIILDPKASGALSLSGNASIVLAGGVFVDSSSPTALSASGNAAVRASVIDVHGGVQQSGNATISPGPVSGAATLADPLSGLALPNTSGLTNFGSVSLSGNSSATIDPGIYSQISVTGAAKLTLNGGVYIIEGGGFSVSGNASVSGSGVTIFNVGSKYPTTGGTYGSINLSGGGIFSLSPPTAGAYAGVLIFQPKDNTNGLSISGDGSLVTGEIYAPAAELSESGNGQLNTSIVVGTLTISGNGVINAVTLNAPAGTVAHAPAQVRAAYGINTLPLGGAGQTIAIVDAYDNPGIWQSLDAFDARFSQTDSRPTLYDQYGPSSSFLSVLNQYGQPTSLPGTGPKGPGAANWEFEEAPDVESAHAFAPGARIILVEANSQTLADLLAAVAVAASQPGVSVVSMGWGFTEGQTVLASDEAAYDQVFNVPRVTFIASTGGYGMANPEYPASSPNLVAILRDHRNLLPRRPRAELVPDSVLNDLAADFALARQCVREKGGQSRIPRR